MEGFDKNYTKTKKITKRARKLPKPKLPKEIPDEKMSVEIAPFVSELRILKACPNPQWLLAALPDGTAVNVQAPVRLAPRLIGKVVPVSQAVDHAGETYYKYAP